MVDYGLLKCKHTPANIRTNKKENFYMTIKNIMEKLKIVSSLVCQHLWDRPCDFMALLLWRSGAIFYRLPITAFIQRGFQPEVCSHS